MVAGNGDEVSKNAEGGGGVRDVGEENDREHDRRAYVVRSHVGEWIELSR